jgi:protoporphyrinogen oxidase
MSSNAQVAIIGAGFTGLAAGYELAKNGIAVTILEAAPQIGGLAAAFEVGGRKLDCFYHHWFASDRDALLLVDELGLNSRLEINPTNTGIYFANNFFRLSKPLDLLKFTPLTPVDRLRLGLVLLRARRVKDWLPLENKLAHEWLRELGGTNVYKVVWQPLLQGKFGPYAEDISAVWFWNKLKLRGGSRGKAGEERLAYFKGGFVALAEALAHYISRRGGCIELSAEVTRLDQRQGQWQIETSTRTYAAGHVIATPALPRIADMIRTWADPEYLRSLEAIKYMGNVCLILQLDRPLTKTYWLNVNDPSFPFVGIIEHTNFQSAEDYGGRHIVYLSKYLPPTDEKFSMSSDEFLEYALPYLKVMFPAFRREWVKAHHLWRARWAQPIVGKHYSRYIPDTEGPRAGFHICSMAQIYPEDRGTNYAIRHGRLMGAKLASSIRAESNGARATIS